MSNLPGQNTSHFYNNNRWTYNPDEENTPTGQKDVELKQMTKMQAERPIGAREYVANMMLADMQMKESPMQNHFISSVRN
jgi:hypothetical protein